MIEIWWRRLRNLASRERQTSGSIQPQVVIEKSLQEKIQEAKDCLRSNSPLDIWGEPDKVDKIIDVCLAPFQKDEKTMILDMRIPSSESEEERVFWAKEGFIPQVESELKKLEPDFSFGRLKQLPLSGELAKMLNVFLNQHGNKELLMVAREADNFSMRGAFLAEFVRHNYRNPRLNFILGRESGPLIRRGHLVKI